MNVPGDSIRGTSRVARETQTISVIEQTPGQFPVFAEIFDESPVGVAIVKSPKSKDQVTGERIFANATLARQFGYDSVAELVAQPIAVSWADPADLARFEALMAERKNVINFEARRLRRDGSEWWALLNTNPVTVDGQSCTIVWHLDVTERKRGEAELEFRSEIIEKMLEGVIVVSPRDQKIVYANTMMERMFGYEKGELVGQPVAVLNFPEDEESARLPDDIFQAVRTTGVWSGEVHNIRKDGSSLWCYANVTSFDHPAFGPTTISVHTDITDRKAAEDSRQHALALAERANRAKSEFLATVSHEFRTPLNAILGFSEMLREEYFGPLGGEQYVSYANDIHDSGTHMLALINDVLDISAIEAGKRTLEAKKVDVGKVLASCAKHLAGQAGDKGVVLTLDANPATPALILADTRSLTQIFLNLLSNAVKFTEAGGRVTAAVTATQGEVRTKVTDTGAGIPPQMLDRIFEPFTQVHGNPHISQTGTGLGLTIVDSLVAANGGTLKLESTLGEGTTVTVVFPELAD